MHALLALIVLTAAPPAPLPLDAAVRRAVEIDPRLRAAGVRVREAEAAETAALGAFDLVLGLDLEVNSTRRTANRVERIFSGDGGAGGGLPDVRTDKVSIDTLRGTLDASLTQPLVWGTVLRVGWIHGLTSTDDPLFPCGALLTEEQCYESRVQLSLVQPLLRGAGRDATESDVAGARAAQTVAQRERRAVAAGLVEGLVGAYLELAHAQAERAIREQAHALALEQLEASRARLALGQLAPVDLPAVEQAVAERAQALDLAAQRVADRDAALATLLELDGAPGVAVPDPETWPGTEAAAVEAAVANNPDLAVLDAEIARQRTALPRLEDATLPQLDLTVVASQTGHDEDLGGAVVALSDNETHFYGASLGFQLPLRNRAAEGTLAQARLAVERARLEREARRREVAQAAAEAWRAVQTAVRNEARLIEIAGLSERTLAAERARFDAGRTTNLEVLRVQQSYEEAQLAVARARVDRLLTTTRLRRLTGDLLDRFALTLTDSPP